MESNVSTRGSGCAGEASTIATGAESVEDLRECVSGETGSAPSLFPDVILEILCRLPLRSLGKLQLVCKEWRGFIRCRYLMERNMNRRKIICHWHNSKAPNDESNLNQDSESFILLDGIDGLLLIMSTSTLKLTIWNPITQGVLSLPDQDRGTLGVTFSYVKSTGNYLLVSIYKDESDRESCKVLTPGMSESWRPLAFPDVAEAEGLRERQYAEVVSAGQAVHTVLVLKVGSKVTKKVVSLDLGTERFHITCFAEARYNDLKKLRAIDWNGKLALVTVDGTDLHVTELEDYKKQRWCREDKVIPLPFLRKGTNAASLLMPLFAKDGEIWYRFGDSLTVIHRIETGRYTHIITRGLSRAGKLYPYKPTL
ncbi:F-box protein [Dorcoceras hygrometricum]|uniref:F-box protein n=1 Tax=Dorcoceras hygrometricum TaxID=472368 RepID=A0A2Z7AAQ6_9LAMI|nr:F-box protein [Dorcoceras hygrometricum]